MEKKRGRKKKTETSPVEKIPKKRGRKPKGGKIITNETKEPVNQEIKSNIILHLKCTLNDIETSEIQSLHQYNPTIENIECYPIGNKAISFSL